MHSSCHFKFEINTLRKKKIAPRKKDSWKIIKQIISTTTVATVAFWRRNPQTHPSTSHPNVRTWTIYNQQRCWWTWKSTWLKQNDNFFFNNLVYFFVKKMCLYELLSLFVCLFLGFLPSIDLFFFFILAVVSTDFVLVLTKMPKYGLRLFEKK